MKIGFIGFGEAASCICLGLYEQGIQGIVAYDVLAKHETIGKLVHDRADQTGVTLYDSPVKVAQTADILFVAVPSSYTLDVCKTVLSSLKKDQIYVDVTASTPNTKKQIWSLLKDTGVLFADAAMLGSLPQDKHRVPITASGNGAIAFCDAMSKYGMRITCVEGEAGAASAIKLIRSIFMKGIASLMIEMLQAANAYNVTDEVVSSIANSMDGIAFTDHLKRLVTGTAIHANRRAAELKGSIQMLDECGIDDSMTVASKHKHDLLDEYRFNERYITKTPSGYQEIIDLLKKNHSGWQNESFRDCV